MSEPYDILILGGGPGGYVAALHAARRKARVALIDEGGLGGTCLHRGCIPSKAWIASAELALKIREGPALGITAKGVTVDWPTIVKRQRAVVQKLAGGLAALLKGAGVTAVAGRGVITTPHTVKVGDTVLEGNNLIIAVGTEPTALPILPVDGKRIHDTNTIFNLERLPASMLIVGGGMIGCEMASLFNALGTGVTVVEKLPEILATEEPFIGRALKKTLVARGVQVQTGTEVRGDIKEEIVLVAVGRKMAAPDIGFEGIGLKRGNGMIATDDRMRTNVAGVYAIGDCVGKTQLAHGASREGIVAVNHILGNEDRVDYHQIPYGIFTIPEIAGVGEKERFLKDRGIKYTVGRFAYGACGKALCDGEAEGSAMILTEEGEGRIVGASIIGHHATDILAEITLAIRHGLSASAIGAAVHSHPTYSEIVLEAAEDSYGMALHKARSL